MNVNPFNLVQVGSFLVEVQHLHNVVYGAEGMSTFIKVLCISGCTAIVTEGLLVLILSYCEAPSGLSNVGFDAGTVQYSSPYNRPRRPRRGVEV